MQSPHLGGLDAHSILISFLQERLQQLRPGQWFPWGDRARSCAVVAMVFGLRLCVSSSATFGKTKVEDNEI